MLKKIRQRLIDAGYRDAGERWAIAPRPVCPAAKTTECLDAFAQFLEQHEIARKVFEQIEQVLEDVLVECPCDGKGSMLVSDGPCGPWKEVACLSKRCQTIRGLIR